MAKIHVLLANRHMLNLASLSNHSQRYSSPANILDRILQDSEKAIGTARQDLSLAVSKHPVHGYFTSLKYVLLFTIAIG